MQRYFCNNNKETYSLNKEDSYHIIKVMRYKIGESLEIVNNSILTICTITNIENNIVYVKEFKKEKTNNELEMSITLAQSLVKEQKMDYIIQKTTELGISEIIGIQADRSIININGKDKKKLERWNKIAKEASEQSKRNKIPTFSNIININELTKLDYDLKLMCSVNEETISIKKVLSNIKNNDRIIFVIGPEGGFTEKEEKLLKSNGFVSISLGDRVLRTETASLFVMSCINYELMR